MTTDLNAVRPDSPAGLSTNFPDGRRRCAWCQRSDLYIRYHDEEWGFASVDDTALFEKLCLEGFQAGLSWLTILNKRENFRAAFDNFDADKIAAYDAADVRRLISDAGIVRHRGKIESTINNARRMLELAAEFGTVCTYVWLFEPPQRRVGNPAESSSRSTSIESVELSKDLKRRGWTFVGPTTMYAFMQAMGLVNDHHEGCVIKPRAQSARDLLERHS